MMGPIQPLAAKPGGKIIIYVRRIKHYENQKDEKLKLLKEQQETERKIRNLIQNLVDFATSN